MAEVNIVDVDQNLEEPAVEGIEFSSSSSEDEKDIEIIEEVSNRTNRVKEHNVKLEERCKSLRDGIQELKSKLHEEKELWKLEVEEANKLGNVPSVDTELMPDYFSSNSNSNASINDLYEYEQNLLIYQDNIAKVQAEKRAHIRRQIALNNYQRRLLEVETMCNMELLRVKQNFRYLQPLQAIVSNWQFKNEKGIGDEHGNHTDKEKKADFTEINSKEDSDEYKTLPKEISISLESLGDKIQVDVNEMFEKLRNQCKTIPQMRISSSSSISQYEEDTTNVGHEVSWSYSQDFTLPPSFF